MGRGGKEGFRAPQESSLEASRGASRRELVAKKSGGKVSPGRGAGRWSPPSGAVLAQDTRGQCCVANVAEPQLAAGSPAPLWSLKSAAKLNLESS